MTSADFQKLQYGNAVQDAQGRLSLITFVDRDAKGNTLHVGLTSAIAVASAAHYKIVSKNTGETVLVTDAKGNAVLTGSTIQGA